MELHGTQGRISMSLDHWYEPERHDQRICATRQPCRAQHWIEAAPPTVSLFANVIAFRPAHFFACLRGNEQPLLTAEHACHVLEIIVKAGQSHKQAGRLN